MQKVIISVFKDDVLSNYPTLNTVARGSTERILITALDPTLSQVTVRVQLSIAALLLSSYVIPYSSYLLLGHIDVHFAALSQSLSAFGPLY